MAKLTLSSQRLATIILSITILSFVATDIVSADYAGVVSDQFIGLSHRSGRRFMASLNSKKGDKCGPEDATTCSPADDGTQLTCCKNSCRSLVTDRNNCGVCGNKCGFGQLCCNGGCVAVAYDVSNCGACGTICQPGLRCEYGSCGYA